MRDVQLLATSYAILIMVCGATLITRFVAAHHHGLPLLAVHIFFLLLVLGALALRMTDLVVLPCFFTLESHATVTNFLANAPIMIMFTIFTMLLYHTFIVVHSIHLSYEPIFAQSRPGVQHPNCISPEISLQAHGAPLRQHSSSQMAPPCDAAQSGSPRLTLPPASSLQVHSPNRQRGLCKMRCRFWVMLWGRPHSTVKMAMILLNTVMWLLFVLVLLLDSNAVFPVDVRHAPTRLDIVVYLLELPSVVFASLISICFSVSGAKLYKRLRDLRRILEHEALDASAPSDAEPQLQSSSLASPLRDGNDASSAVIVMGSVASDGRLAYEHGGTGSGYHLHSEVGIPTSATFAASVRYSVSSSAAHAEATRSRISERGSGASIRHRSYSRMSLSSVTASFMNVDEPILTLAGVKLLISGVRRMLVVVGVCVTAFLYRALFLVYLALSASTVFPRRIWLPYLMFSEVVPYAVLLIFYLLPGLQAVCAKSCLAGRREDVSASVDTTGEA